MFFADAEPFWKPPNVFDVAGAVGVILALFSIWFSWWLAKRDIEKRLDEASAKAAKAARDEVRRVARAVLQTGISAAVRSLELAREVCNGKRWSRTAELCLLANEQLARVFAQPAVDEITRNELRDVAASLQDSVTRLRAKRTAQEGKGEAPEGVLAALDGAILTLHRVESRMTGIQTEGDYGP